MFNKKNTCLLPVRVISVISKYELNINLHVLLAQPQKIVTLRAITFQNGCNITGIVLLLAGDLHHMGNTKNGYRLPKKVEVDTYFKSNSSLEWGFDKYLGKETGLLNAKVFNERKASYLDDLTTIQNIERLPQYAKRLTGRLLENTKDLTFTQYKKDLQQTSNSGPVHIHNYNGDNAVNVTGRTKRIKLTVNNKGRQESIPGSTSIPADTGSSSRQPNPGPFSIQGSSSIQADAGYSLTQANPEPPSTLDVWQYFKELLRLGKDEFHSVLKRYRQASNSTLHRETGSPRSMCNIMGFLLV